MKTLAAAFAGILLSAAASFAQGSSYQQGGQGQGRVQYDIVKIEPAAVLTPQYSISIGPQHTSPRAQQWLEVEVDFTSNVPWTDELTFRYYIDIAGQCLTGEVTHVAIQRGRDLYSVMYVSPQALAQVLRGKPMSGNDLVDVGVQIVNQGQVLVTKSYKARGDAQWWESMKQVTGLVLNKNQTPFSPLFWDRYEMIKIPAATQ